MTHRIALVIVAVLGISGLLTGGTLAEPMGVFAGIPPLAEIVERIGGDHVAVQILLDEGQDPHTFSPSPKKIMRLRSAQVFFAAGLEFEKQISRKISNSSDLRIVIVAERMDLPNCTVAGHDHAGHDHGAHNHAGDDHTGCNHAGQDPHIWLSLPLINQQAAIVAEILQEIDPANAGQYATNLEQFTAEVSKLHEEIATLMKPYKGESFFTFHPAFAYFCADYGIVEKAVEIAGKQPTPKQLATLISSARADKVRILFTQPQFDDQSARTIAQAIGGEVMPLDPMAKDLLSNLRYVANSMARSFER